MIMKTIFIASLASEQPKKKDRVDESQVGSGAKHTSAFAFKKANTYLNGIIKMIRMMQKTHNVNR
jgi:hypothetical protein